ncbi:precorrin-6y C5,15-methyltransferase (decarboxylating) subunit CbiE [Tissierellaceae bacterium BX21]|uniref:Precorrin-6y C5,15-methyltransferase (Decarboxylating) subunit CbiE n=1 Tax=Paratissierella segnis TaxID=2763679 RepID=A0A926EV27_9FIRM|nr:precorrin-6y C5,15-methyltransferase (decarboxylating) subunit CbiE [Paratissierella segnis]
MTVAGAGPGNPKYLTVEVLDRIKNAKSVLVFGRIGNSISSLRKDCIIVNKVDEIIEYTKENEDVLLLASGDPNFYGIVDYLKRNGVYIEEVLPGLSSFQYLMAKLKKPWQDAGFLSLHGRGGNLNEIKDNKLTIMLIDKEKNASYISRELFGIGIRGYMYIGYNLSYEDEKIVKIKIGEVPEDYSSLGVVVIENEMD